MKIAHSVIFISAFLASFINASIFKSLKNYKASKIKASRFTDKRRKVQTRSKFHSYVWNNKFDDRLIKPFGEIETFQIKSIFKVEKISSIAIVNNASVPSNVYDADKEEIYAALADKVDLIIQSSSKSFDSTSFKTSFMNDKQLMLKNDKLNVLFGNYSLKSIDDSMDTAAISTKHRTLYITTIDDLLRAYYPAGAIHVDQYRFKNGSIVPIITVYEFNDNQDLIYLAFIFALCLLPHILEILHEKWLA